MILFLWYSCMAPALAGYIEGKKLCLWTEEWKEDSLMVFVGFPTSTEGRSSFSYS